MRARPQQCLGERRRHLVRAAQAGSQAPLAVAMDWLEVDVERSVVTVHFIGQAPMDLLPENFVVEGGRRVRDLLVREVVWSPRRSGDAVVDLHLDKSGDFSPYTLRLVEDRHAHPPQRHPLADPCYDALELRFDLDCPQDVDCGDGGEACATSRQEPLIDYLAKDYASFRQLLLDRLALVMPDWQERNPADIGIALVEVLAYVGDHLSYQQDAVGTEAYLASARQRISVARHARLVDYRLHEGCNARAWLALSSNETNLVLPLRDESGQPRVQFATSVAGRVQITRKDLSTAGRADCAIFETLVPNRAEGIVVRRARNEIRFWTWGDERCCLPRGAKVATLVDDGLELCVGDVLILEEVRGSRTGLPEDADPTHRHAVRLVRITEVHDPLFPEPPPPVEQSPVQATPVQATPVQASAVARKGHHHPPEEEEDCEEPSPEAPVGRRLLEVEWSAADALPFPLCLSAVVPRTVDLCGPDSPEAPEAPEAPDSPKAPKPKAPKPTKAPGAPEGNETRKAKQDHQEGQGPGDKTREECVLVEVSVARGNVILVDHGETRAPQELGEVPPVVAPVVCCDTGVPDEVEIAAGRFRPRLDVAPLTHREPPTLSCLCQEPPKLPACALGRQDARAALAALQVSSTLDGAAATWVVRADLLDSGADDRDVVVEVDNQGRGWLRFPRFGLGRSPAPGEAFRATCRVGNGPAGNVPRDAITTVVIDDTGTDLRARNPLPSRGGVAPEPVEDAKLFAPELFRTRLERAVTEEDYARLAERALAEPCDPETSAMQRAAARLAWTGSWYDMRVALDPAGRRQPEASMIDEATAHLERYRRIGHDLTVGPAEYVPLRIHVRICVVAGRQRAEVRAAVLRALIGRTGSGKRPAFFAPDSLTFDQEVDLSALVATIQGVDGVASVSVARFERLFDGPGDELAEGRIALGPMEVARLDNDPGDPDAGVLRLELRGGR